MDNRTCKQCIIENHTQRICELAINNTIVNPQVYGENKVRTFRRNKVLRRALGLFINLKLLVRCSARTFP